MRVIPSCAAIAVLAFAGKPAVSAQSYDVTALPFTQGGLALNNAGVVVGGVASPSGSVSLGEWSNGVLTNLGAPSGLPSSLDIVQPIGINDPGAIVGYIHGAHGGLPFVSFIYSGGGFTVLPLVNSTDLGGVATAINARGEIVGYDLTASNNAQPWLWSSGAYSSVPVSATWATALGINASGTIIGNRLVDDQAGERGYISGHGTAQYLTTGSLNAINDAGEVVGASTSIGNGTATIFEHGTATSILSVPSSASGINSAGDVVGFYQPAGINGPRIFLWEPSLGALDLTPGGYLFAVALAINSRGEIVGYGETTGGVFQDFLLIPDPHGVLTATALLTSPPGVSGVPEPDTVFLLVLGLAVTIVTRCRKSRAWASLSVASVYG